MALLERQRPDVTTPTPDGGQRVRRGSPILRAYSSAVIGLSAFADRVKAYRDAANDPAVYESRRTRRAVALLGAAGGVLALGVSAEVAKANGVHVPFAPSDLFTGSNSGFGGKVADCVNDATSSAPAPKDGLPHPQPGVPVDVFEACVDQAKQAAQPGK
jgi:hypothetical protein